MTALDDARRMRCQLAPVAWVALEVLVAAGEPATAGTVISPLTAAEVAAELGVGRDTATAAISRLRRCLLVDFTAGRTRRGRFESGHYTVSASAVSAVTTLVPSFEVGGAHGAGSGGTVRRRSEHEGRVEVAGQVSLFDVGGEDDGGSGTGGGHGHELASEMPASAGDVSGDGRDGARC